VNNWIEVSADRLTQNFHAIQTEVGPATTILAVIKANAYGHGAATCAPILARAGAQWLGVTCADEGVRIRHALQSDGIAPAHQPQILIMSGFLPADAPAIHAHGLTPVVWTQQQIAWLTPYPGTRVHVEIDTGMGRQGVAPGPALEALLASLATAGLIPDGFFTHFCSSEVAHAAITAEQQRRFAAILPTLRQLPRKPTWLHAANSSAIDNPEHPIWLATLADTLGANVLVRPGLALYGYTLPLEGAPTPRLHAALQPVLTWKAHILATRTLAPGDTVGYNAIFTAPTPLRVALLPAGYADGLRRELSATNQKPGGWVLIDGHRAPILGRISMNLTVVDITSIPCVQPNDQAILLGDGITAEDHARLAHTIPYEILCGIHPCN
jgi:alanine racemase